MTLIIGVRCKDGVATVTNIQMQPTIQTPVKKKLQVIAGQVVIGVSGNVGLGQRFAKELEASWGRKEFVGKGSLEASAIIRAAVWRQLAPEVEIARQAAGAFGQAAINNVLTATAVAIPVSDVPCLFQFDHQGLPCEATEDLPLFAFGSGQMIADPFLAFLRRIFWRESFPTVAQAMLSTVWTLRHAILTNPGGVNNPIQIVTLRREGKGWCAKELQESEWGEHDQDIKDAEHALANFRELLRRAEAPTPAPPPPK
jgi:20S proteasome alpha/beta subunit